MKQQYASFHFPHLKSLEFKKAGTGVLSSVALSTRAQLIMALFSVLPMEALENLPMVPLENLPMVPSVAIGTFGNQRTLEGFRQSMVPAPMLPLVETLVPMVPLVGIMMSSIMFQSNASNLFLYS